MAAWMLYTLKLPARFRQASQYQNKWSSSSPFQFEVHPFSSFSSWPTQLASCFILRESPSNHLWARAKLAGLFNTCCWLGKQPAMNWSRQQLPGITQKNFNWKHIIPHHTIKSQGPDQHVCCVSCSVFSINMAKLTKAHLEVKYSAWTVRDLHTAVVIVSTDLNSSPWKRRHDRCWLGDCWILFTGAFRAGDDSTAADTLGDWKRASKNWRFVPLKTYAILK